MKHDNGKVHGEYTEFLGKILIDTPEMARNLLNESKKK